MRYPTVALSQEEGTVALPLTTIGNSFETVISYCPFRTNSFKLRLGPKYISPVPDIDDAVRLRLSKCIFESVEKISSFHKLSDPRLISQPLTLSRELVSISLNTKALGIPMIVSTTSGKPDLPGLFIISALYPFPKK